MKKFIIILVCLSSSLDTSGERVRATVYHAVAAECNKDPGHTAFMFELDLSNPYKHRIIAVSRDLLKKYPNKTKVLVMGTGKYDGIYTVRDKMNKRFKHCIDILINEGMSIGCWNDVQITKIKDEDKRDDRNVFLLLRKNLSREVFLSRNRKTIEIPRKLPKRLWERTSGGLIRFCLLSIFQEISAKYSDAKSPIELGLREESGEDVQVPYGYRNLLAESVRQKISHKK